MTNTFDVNIVLYSIGTLSFAAMAIFALLLTKKTGEVQELRTSLDKMTRSFNELDEQAKLIVKTDMELNKAQEELDRRLASLDALQKTSRLISTTLDANEIFQRLNKSLVAELGFEKSLTLMFDEQKNLVLRTEAGFSKNAVERIMRLLQDNSFLSLLKEGRLLSSESSPKQKKAKITQIFDVEHFILSSILSQDGILGFLFVGNNATEAVITKGDEELISILSNQIGQSLENAQLFEQVYKSRQELESKIQERTKELAFALEEVQKISKTKSEFISAVSHELRTPLTSIKGYAAILMAGKLGDIPPEVKERLEKINKHSDSLVKFINELLDISRIESGRVQMTMETHDIHPLVDEISDILTPQLKEKNIRLAVSVPANIPPLFMDTSQIQRVFINLLGNAVKFTPPSGSINIKAQLDKDHVVFEIADSGIGIKEDDIAKLFTEFYRVDNEINQTAQGTGLGLVLVKKIIEAHRGKIWVTSKVGQGTTFHFTLPTNKK